MSNASPNRELRIEIRNNRRHTHGPMELHQSTALPKKTSSRSHDCAYDNQAYVGSTNSINQPQRNQTTIVVAPPTTTVYREQYWACSKWPYRQRILALMVGLLIGVVVGLTITLAMNGDGNGIDIGGIFRSHTIEE